MRVAEMAMLLRSLATFAEAPGVISSTYVNCLLATIGNSSFWESDTLLWNLEHQTLTELLYTWRQNTPAHRLKIDLYFLQNGFWQNLVAEAFNPSTWEAEAGGSL